MDNVSGFRLISCNAVTIKILSAGRRASRSEKAPAIVEMARRKLEDTSLERGAPGSARSMWRCSASVMFFEFCKKDRSSSTCARPSGDRGES